MNGPARGRRPTSADVAREAGLSRATVGYVLNEVPHQSIPEPTRQRVFAAAAKLGYTPSAAARSLRSGRSNLVLCLLPDWPVGPAVAGLMSELSIQLAEHGLTFVSHQRAAGGRPLGDVWKAINPMAVLVLDQIDPDDASALTAAGLMVSVAVRDGPNDPHLLGVTDERIGRIQVEHLAAGGRTRIGYAYPTDERLLTFARPRLRGAQQTCAELGLEPPVVQPIDLTLESTRRAIEAWQAADPPVDGVCAYNDEIAIALLAALRRNGQAVPDDVAVIGVDNIPLARVCDPPLTSLNADARALARYLTERVLKDLNGEGGRMPLRSDSDLIRLTVRAST